MGHAMGFDIRQAYTIGDLREVAQKKLPKGLFEFMDRGTEDELALKRNRAGFDQICLRPKVLVDVSGRTLRARFAGQESTMPLAVAPTGAAGLLSFDGEIAIARAARKLGIPFTLSTASFTPMERVAEEAGGRLWFQLYMWPDRAMSYQLVERVKAAGYEALIVTVDTAVTPNREYNRRNGFTLPMKITRKNMVDVATHPEWFFKVFMRYLLRSGIPTLENYPPEYRQRLVEKRPGHQAGLPKSDSVNWDDLRELRKRWKGTLMVKGILHPDDAQVALDCGVDAIVVSNHGGRNLDSSIAPIDALPDIVAKVNGRVDVLMDSGIQRGSDIFKALALGAKGVFAGRAPLWGVTAAGEDGAFRALDILREELERIMGFTGCVTLNDINQSLLWFDQRASRA